MDTIQSSRSTEPIEMKKAFVPLIYLVLVAVGSTTAISFNAIGSRIVGGTNATKFQFPYYAQIVVMVKVNETSNRFANCGGSVISSTFILTAAHCVSNKLPNDVRIILGFYSVDDRKGARPYYVKSLLVHEEYNSTARSNDIALIEVTKEIQFTDLVQPIQLICNYTYPDVKTLVAGTGITSDADKKLSTTLQWTNLTTISNKQCTKLLGGIHTSNICAVGQPKQGPCHGDSGTALIRELNGTQTQIGVLSWGLMYGCERGYPSVFMRISHYAGWIKKHSGVSCVDEE